MRKIPALFALLVGSFAGSGCGGGGSSSSTDTVYVTISPLYATVKLGSTQHFTATTSGSTNTDVSWKVNGITGGNSSYGTISSSGLYTPPSTVPSPNTVTVTVESQANTADIANAGVTITSDVAVSVSPPTADLQLGQTQQFTATVSGNSNTAVTWKAGGVAGGNSTVGIISSSGLYTAPSTASTPLAVSVTAVSQVDATKSATASITVHGGIKVSLSPSPATVQTYGKLQFTASVAGTNNSGITWQVDGVNGGTPSTGAISSSGLYTAPPSVPTQASNGKTQTTSVIVSAISQADSTANAIAIVTITTRNQAVQNVPIPLGVSGGSSLDANSGSQTSGCCGGTLGALVSRGGNLYILSNNHVVARSDQARLGESIIQPSLTDASCSPSSATGVANLSQFVNLESPVSGKPLVDAGLAQIIADKVDPQGTILQLGATTTNGQPSDAPPRAGSGVPATPNMTVAKSGRSTGLTCSTISAVNVTANMEYPRSCGSDSTFTVTYTDLVTVAGSGFSADGDSGALIVTQDTADPVALVVASTDADTVATPVSDVLTALADPSSGELPVFVGTSDGHSVAACSVASAQTVAGLSSEALSTVPADRLQAAEAVRDAQAAQLISTYGALSVGIGASLDDPGHAAILLFVPAERATDSLPQEIGGVRTRIVQVSTTPHATVLSAVESASLLRQLASHMYVSALTKTELSRAQAAKDQRGATFLALKGVQGVGVGASADHPGKAALAVFVVRGVSHDAIPKIVDGVRTQVRESSPYRLRTAKAATGSCKARGNTKR
jgi:hypothetical protein